MVRCFAKLKGATLPRERFSPFAHCRQSSLINCMMIFGSICSDISNSLMTALGGYPPAVKEQQYMYELVRLTASR